MFVALVEGDIFVYQPVQMEHLNWVAGGIYAREVLAALKNSFRAVLRRSRIPVDDTRILANRGNNKTND